jgi:hypothetical protein
MVADSPIPLFLHQTWKTLDLPEDWAANARGWRDLHPTWQYRLWTDEDNRTFIAQHYPDLLPAFDAYPYNIMRADMVRYCLLHHYGGVYADLDIECLRPLDELLTGAGFVAVYEPEEQSAWVGTDVLSNAFMASRPGHPFLEAVLRRLAGDPSTALTHLDVLHATGPVMLTQVFRTYAGGGLTLLPSHTIFPFASNAPELAVLRTEGPASDDLRAALKRRGAFAVHYWANSWVGTLAGELVNPDPGAVPGYDFFPGLDSPGSDIANLGRDIRRAAAACDSMRSAVAFNTDGFAKDRLLPRDEWISIRHPAPNTGLYVKRTARRSGVFARLRSFAGSLANRRR